MFMRSVLFSLLLLSILFCSCSQVKIKLTISGTVYRDGKPTSGTVRLFSPENLSVIAEAKTMKDGKFLLRDVPPGEWLIGLTGRTGGLIGNYHYVKVTKVNPVSDYVLEVTEEDPKAKALLEKYNNQNTDNP